MKMRAAILTMSAAERPYASTRPLVVDEVMLDPPGAEEVLIEVRAAGLCHSDLSVIDGSRPRPLPMVLGHECAGVVAELGTGVTDFRVGDPVVAAFVPSCRACRPCRQGRPALCEPAAASNAQGTLLGGTRRLHRAGSQLHHHLGVSAFAEFATVSRRSLVRIDAGLPFEVAALFGCAVTTGVGAVVNTAAVGEGASVAIIGLGGVGLAALLGARVARADELLAIDLSDAKLALARDLGATHVFNAGDPYVADRVRDLTHGGVEFAFEMAGSVRALELAYRITRRGGTTVTAGLSRPDAHISIAHLGLVTEERTLKGSYLGSCDPARDVPRFIDWFREGRLPVDRLLSARLGLGELNAGFDTLADGGAVRQLVLP